MAGVDSTGFVQKTLDQIVSSIQTGYRTVYGAGVNVATSSRVGQRIGLFAGALAEVWELGEALFNALDPSAATGAALDNQLKLVGLARKAATSSKVTLVLTGTPTTVVALGKRGKVPTTAAKFATDAAHTIAALDASTDDHDYAVGDRATSNGNAYQVIEAGHSGSVDISGTGASIPDPISGTPVWTYLGPGTGAVDAPATATVTGPVQGFARSINTIDTPVSGWAGVINLVDAIPGADTETDSAARARRDLSLAKGGGDSLTAIRTAVLALPGVTSCTIFENFTDATVDGVPLKSFETVVEGGTDQAIIDAIGSTRPGGIQAYGTTSGTWTDAAGGSHTIAFSRPVDVNVYVKVTFTYDQRTFPADGNTQALDAVVARGNANPVGKDVVASAIGAGVFQDVTGIFDVSQVLIGTSNPPVASTTIAVTPRQRARFDTSRTTIVSSLGSF